VVSENPKEILNTHGFNCEGNVYYNLSIPELYEEVIRRNEGVVGQGGTLVAYTGSHTGRSPADRFIVKEQSSEKNILWSAVNKPIEEKYFDGLYDKVVGYLNKKDVFVRDLFVCAHPDYVLPVRVINELAWHNVFVNNLFIRPDKNKLPRKDIGFTVISAPGFKADPDVDGTRTETFILRICLLTICCSYFFSISCVSFTSSS